MTNSSPPRIQDGITVGYASEFLGGDTSYVKTTLLSQWFFPLPLETVFSVRGRAGYLAPSEGKTIPLFERFTLGGLNSLRGLKDVGPTDSTGLYVIGGTTFLCSTSSTRPPRQGSRIKGASSRYGANLGYVPLRRISGTRRGRGRWFSPLAPWPRMGVLPRSPDK